MSTQSKIAAVAKIVAHQEVGRYRLPDEIVAAFTRRERVAATVVAVPASATVAAAAGRFVESVAAGEPVDILELGRVLHQADADAQAAVMAHRVVQAATDLAAAELIELVEDQADAIIAGPLREAWSTLLDEARQAVADLAGYSLDDVRGLLTAPAKPRNAYAALTELASRRVTLWEVRRQILHAASVAPAVDTQNKFVEFRTPQAVNGWKLPAPWPGVPAAPTDAMQRLVWLTSPVAEKATPWFPTVPEQDAAAAAIDANPLQLITR